MKDEEKKQYMQLPMIIRLHFFPIEQGRT